jgi:hypothetical protein
MAKDESKQAFQLKITEADRSYFDAAAQREGFDYATQWAVYHLRRLSKGLEATTLPDSVRHKLNDLSERVETVEHQLRMLED